MLTRSGCVTQSMKLCVQFLDSVSNTSFFLIQTEVVSIMLFVEVLHQFTVVEI